MGGLPAGKLSDEELPAVGDWVAVRPVEGERKAIIEAVLPRRTSFSRKEANTENRGAGRGRERRHGVRRHRLRLRPQPEAARALPHVRVGQRFEPRSSSSTRAIPQTDPIAELLEVEPVTMGVPVHAVSAVTGEGLETLDPYLAAGADDRPPRLVGGRQVDAREPPRRARGPGHCRHERGRARAAHDVPPRARAAALGRRASRHARHARATALGRRRGPRHDLLRDQRARRRVQVLGLRPRAASRDARSAGR